MATPSDNKDTTIGTRLNKFVAHAGLGSRRKAADWVKAGKVSVNGKVEINPAYLVQETDSVSFDGEIITPQNDMVYFLMNKPKNTVTTLSDERGRKTVMDIFDGKIKQRIFPVGRLDRQTTGLLLFTNDGDLAKKLTHPSFEVPKVYEASLDKPLKDADLEKIKNGLTLEDGPAPVDWINYPEKDKQVVRLEIHIGRNRIVRRLFQHLGYEVVKLDRIYFAGLTKKDIGRGRWRPLREEEIRMLKHFT